MSNEIAIQQQLTIRNGNMSYRNGPLVSFLANQSNIGGPAPGQIIVATTGTDVSFSQLTLPGVVHLENFDPTNFFTYGIWDGAKFQPLGEVLAGEQYILRLSRELGYDYITGTGTTGSGNTLRLKADTASIRAFVGAFEV